MGFLFAVKRHKPEQKKTVKEVVLPEKFVEKKIKIEEQKPRPKPKLCLIIDDVGYGGRITKKLLKLDYPLTLSVLPHAPYAKKIAKKAYLKGFEILLHLPMEPDNSSILEPFTIKTGMGKRKVSDIISKALLILPWAKGVNNHMGSKVTRDKKMMKIILGSIKEKKLFFIDSRVTPDTVAYDIALEMGVPCGYKTLFLDSNESYEEIKETLEDLMFFSKKNGWAIGIGHVKYNTIKVLKEMLPEIEKSDIELIYASEIVKTEDRR
jgi:polysaccharide deacetylase 2 family uncharacterized protein YibQ